jgi:hypothetical protein
VAIVGLSLAATRGRAAAACPSACTQHLRECKRTCPEGGQERRDCRAACAERSTCTAPGARIRTLAYVVTDCRSDARGIVARQELRVRRGDCEPVTVAAFEMTEPIPDPLGLCRYYGEVGVGAASVVAGVFQRVAVSPDGSGVVFQVTDDLAAFPTIPVPSEQKGIFFARSDGRALRRLGPPARARPFVLFPLAAVPSGFGAIVETDTHFSPDGRAIAFTDLGPGPSGEETRQIVTLDIPTGNRTQVTRLPQAVAADPTQFPTSEPRWLDNQTIGFFSYTNPAGLNPDGGPAFFRVKTDGTGLRRTPTPAVEPGSHIVPEFSIAGPGGALLTMRRPGTPLDISCDPFDSPAIGEVFVVRKENVLLQLTNFQRRDTAALTLAADGQTAFFNASADPLGTNPSESPQIFSINTRGGRLRQLTRFRGAGGSGCLGYQDVCGYGPAHHDPTTGLLVFSATCDLLGTNLNSQNIFAMRPDGRRLRQLTATRGLVVAPDGSVTTELPGPWAYSGRSR